MRSALFDYELPPERIAQTPIEPRDASRLLVLRADGSLESRRFRELPELLSPGDLLVLNDTRVLPARLRGVKLGPGGEPGARVELLLLRRQEEQVWEALVHPGRRVREGARLQFSGSLGATVLARGEEGLRTVRLEAPPGTEAPEAWVERALHAEGQVPLPPYIHTELDNPERYQTVYARHEGSAAAPTAGLHFTPAVFDALRERGVGLAWITLHVGLGTFRPLQGELLAEHRMHEEWCSIPDGTARAIRECRGRVVAVGTTVVRCLETGYGYEDESEDEDESESGYEDEDEDEDEDEVGAGGRGFYRSVGGRRVRPGSRATRLFIQPGYRFRVVDALITNFHTPRSSLLVLVSALAGLEPIRAAYRKALEEEYRFLSFGDAMLIERRSLE